MVRENARLDELMTSLAVRLGLAKSNEIEPLDSTEADGDKTLSEALVERGVLTAIQAKLLKSLVGEVVAKHGTVRDSLGFLDRWESTQSTPDIRNTGPLGSSGTEAVDNVQPSIQETADFSRKDRSGWSAQSPFTESKQRYEIKKFLAQGGIGQVSVAIDREFNREVAFKEIRSDRDANRNQVERFWLEAQITGKLEHPGVVPVYSLGKRENEEPYYAMRFIRGESMTDAIRQFHSAKPGLDDSSRQIQFRKLLQSFVSVCNTIHFAHSQRVIHRDLKPDNVMLGSFGETLVVDWGIAKTLKTTAEGEATEEALSPEESAGDATFDSQDLDHLTNRLIADLANKAATQQGAIMGTFGFMSPEQLLGWQDQIDARSDVFSLGGLLYATLAGRTPNTDESMNKIWQNTLSGTTKPPRHFNPNAPKSLEAVALKAMSPKPAERYQTAAELSADVEAFLADEPVSAYRDPLMVRFRRWLRRHPAIASTTAASIAITLTGLVIGLAVVGSFNKKLEQANGELKTSNQRETRERKRAEDNFRIAESAVETYLEKTSSNPGLATSRFGDLRKSLLETAIPFYQEFLAQRPDESEFSLSQGKARFRLGQIYLQTGDYENGIKQFNLATSVFDKLRAAEPKESDWIRWRCQCQNEMVACMSRQDRHREAAAIAQESIKALTKLFEAEPDNLEALSDLVNVTSNLGVCQFALGQFKAAEASVDRHATLLEKLKSNNGVASSEANYQLATNLNNLGAIQNQQEQWQAAFDPLVKAIKIGNDLLAKHPNVEKYRHIVAQAYHNIGRSMHGTKHHQDAIANFQVAERQDAWLASAYPSVAKYQLSLAMTLNSMGTTYLSWGRRDEAVQSLRKAEQAFQQLVKRFPEVPEYRLRLALAHSNLGLGELGLDEETRDSHYQAAIELLQKLIQESPESAEYRYHLAAAQINLGVLLREQQQFDAAVKWYLAAEANSRQLPEESLNSKSSRMNANWGLGECYVELGDHAKAAEAWQTAARSTRDPTLKHVFEVKSAKSNALAGAIKEARETTEQVLQFPQRNAETYFQVAEILAICAGKTDSDPVESKQLKATAIELLQRAKSAGGFQQAKLVGKLKDSKWIREILDESQIQAMLE